MMRTRRIVILLSVWALSSMVAMGQMRLSVDVKMVQVASGKKVTTERSLYLNPDGRLVAEQHSPTRLVTLSNSLGEVRIYDPATNQLAVMNDKQMASSKELVAMFASGSYVDMALPLYGYRQSDSRSEDGVLIKTFTPTATSAVAKVELVFQNHLPICMIYYNAKGTPVRKLYFSRYNYERIPMPMRVTEIEYISERDSLVRLSTYSNLLFDGEASSDMFDYTIPANATRTEVDPKTLLGK